MTMRIVRVGLGRLLVGTPNGEVILLEMSRS